MHVFTVSFDQLNASLVNKINIFKKYMITNFWIVIICKSMLEFACIKNNTGSDIKKAISLFQNIWSFYLFYDKTRWCNSAKNNKNNHISELFIYVICKKKDLKTPMYSQFNEYTWCFFICMFVCCFLLDIPKLCMDTLLKFSFCVFPKKVRHMTLECREVV